MAGDIDALTALSMGSIRLTNSMARKPLNTIQ